MTKVINIHSGKDYDVYIGRLGPWGNPFKEGIDGSRGDVIGKFNMWFLTSQSEDAKWMRLHVHELKDQTLGCWCKPSPCHGDTLAYYADHSDVLLRKER